MGLIHNIRKVHNDFYITENFPKSVLILSISGPKPSYTAGASSI
jgi:hypothetical protein